MTRGVDFWWEHALDEYGDTLVGDWLSHQAEVPLAPTWQIRLDLVRAADRAMGDSGCTEALYRQLEEVRHLVVTAGPLLDGWTPAALTRSIASTIVERWGRGFYNVDADGFGEFSTADEISADLEILIEALAKALDHEALELRLAGREDAALRAEELAAQLRRLRMRLAVVASTRRRYQPLVLASRPEPRASVMACPPLAAHAPPAVLPLFPEAAAA